MDIIDRVLLDFINEIDVAVDLDSHFLALEKAATALGFENVSYTYVPSVLGKSLQQFAPVFKLSRTYNMAFIERYSQEMFAQHDFTIKRIQSGEWSLRERKMSKYRSHSYGRMSSRELWSAGEQAPSFKQPPPPPPPAAPPTTPRDQPPPASGA